MAGARARPPCYSGGCLLFFRHQRPDSGQGSRKTRLIASSSGGRIAILVAATRSASRRNDVPLLLACVAADGLHSRFRTGGSSLSAAALNGARTDRRKRHGSRSGTFRRDPVGNVAGGLLISIPESGARMAGWPDRARADRPGDRCSRCRHSPSPTD